MTGADSSQQQPVNAHKGEPDPAHCRVAEMILNFAGGWCLVRPVPKCRFGFAHGYGFICQHPDLGQIITRTQAARAARSTRVA